VIVGVSDDHVVACGFGLTCVIHPSPSSLLSLPWLIIIVLATGFVLEKKRERKLEKA